MERQSNDKKSLGLGLPNPDYGPNDILLGRSSSCYNHPGNIRFRKIIEAQAYIYNQNSYLHTRQEKESRVYCVIDILRSRGSRFLRYENGKWKQVGLRALREKIGHALRDKATQQSKQKAKELLKQKYEGSGQPYAVKGLMTRQEPSALEPRNLSFDITSNNTVLVNKNNENNPMSAAAGSLPTMNNNKASFPLTLTRNPPDIGGLLGSWSSRAPPLTAAASLHQPAAVLANLPGTAASVGTLTATLPTATASPAALPPTTQSETFLLLQQSVQQLSQVEHFYNDLRSNIETTVNLLQQVGESTSRQQQQLSQQHQELSHQLLKQQQSTVVTAPNGSKKLARLPWEDDQQPSLSIKVSNKTSTTSRRRNNNNNNNSNPKKRRRRLGPHEVSSRGNQAAEGVIRRDNDVMLEMISSALGRAFGR